jgi:hypothetical protein
VFKELGLNKEEVVNDEEMKIEDLINGNVVEKLEKLDFELDAQSFLQQIQM